MHGRSATIWCCPPPQASMQLRGGRISETMARSR
jgi:hypothetical protein